MRRIYSLILVVNFTLLSFAQQTQQKVNDVVGTSGKLTVSFNTATAGGNRSPYNVIAAWVENSTGALVNTMMYYTNNGNSSAVHMSAWYSLIGSWPSRDVLKNVDGVSGATRSSYGSYTCFWGKTVNISTIADGTYTVGLEICDHDVQNSPGSVGHKLVKYTFIKGAGNSTGVLTGNASSSFSNVSVQWVPAVNAINDPSLEKMYQVYPNPTRSDIFVSGTDIESVQILSLNGRSMFFSKEQKLNLSSLPAGEYLAYITTAKGAFSKKIVKY